MACLAVRHPFACRSVQRLNGYRSELFEWEVTFYFLSQQKGRIGKVYLFHTYWDFRIKFCFVKKRFRFYFDQSQRRNEFLTLEKIVSSNHKSRFKRIVFSRAFSRSSRVALSAALTRYYIFGVLELFVTQTSKLSRGRRYFWGWLNNQEDLCL